MADINASDKVKRLIRDGQDQLTAPVQEDLKKQISGM